MKQLKDYRKEVWNCYRDSMCKYVFTWHVKSERFARICPSLLRYRFDSFCAQGRLDVARALIEKELEWSEKLLDIVYRCQLCGGCDYVCGRVKEIQPGKIIQAMRAQLVAEGKAPPPEFLLLRDHLRRYQNPYGKSNAQRSKWLNDIYQYQPHITREDTTSDELKTDHLLYVGCSTLRGNSAERLPQVATKLLMIAGMDVGLLENKEQCCGNPSLRIGDQDEFVAFAKENIKMFKKMGVKKLICLCPFCYSTFRRDYPEIGDEIDFEVVHILDIISRLIDERKLIPCKEKNITLTYHDPCHLGRISSQGVSGTGAFKGIYEAPRKIMRAIPGLEIVEMERIKDDTFCCGAGSWVKMAYPEFAQSTALERIAEAKSTGAEGLVTYCPHCEENFEEALEKDGKSMKVYDLLNLLLDSV